MTEISQFYKFITKNIKVILVTVTLIELVSVGIFLLPTKYIASGSFYVTREQDNSTQFFTYEGYYAQQTAAAYTNTAVALLESIDLRNEALKKVNIATSEQNLRKYQKNIGVKKKGPQLITLNIKETSSEKADLLWKALADTLISYTQQTNKNSDPKIIIEKVLENPVVKPQFKSIYLNLGIGSFLGLGVSIMYLSFLYYLKNSK